MASLKHPRVLAFTSIFCALSIVLSLLSVPFLLGLRVHFFQVAIFLCSSLAGPFPGLVCGSIAGFYTAIVRADPTILVGNGLLGLASGLLGRKFRPFVACMIAWFLVQAPWILFTGTFILGVPVQVMQTILVLLTVEDLISAALTDIVVVRLGFRSWFNERIIRAKRPSL